MFLGNNFICLFFYLIRVKAAAMNVSYFVILFRESRNSDLYFGFQISFILKVHFHEASLQWLFVQQF